MAYSGWNSLIFRGAGNVAGKLIDFSQLFPEANSLINIFGLDKEHGIRLS